MQMLKQLQILKQVQDDMVQDCVVQDDMVQDCVVQDDPGNNVSFRT